MDKLCEFRFYPLTILLVSIDGNEKVSRPKEPPLKSLSEPYVNLSAHTAPIIQPMVISLTSSVQTDSYHALLLCQANARHDVLLSASCISYEPS